MKIFNIPPGHLVMLDLALAGGFYEAMSRIIKAGGDPQLRAERHKSDDGGPSEWKLLVFGAKQVYRFGVTDAVGLEIVARIYAEDFISEVRRDVAARMQERGPAAPRQSPVGLS